MMPLDRAALAADLRERVFTPAAGAERIGAEVELLPIDRATGARPPIDGPGRTLRSLLRRVGARAGWREECSDKGAPRFAVPGGGWITFEPGGQIEYSAPPSRSVSSLVTALRAVILPLREAAADEGVALLSLGIDPELAVEEVPLMIDCARYRSMAEHFARRGPWGARMMRQTAAMQVSLDFGAEPWRRWRVLNAAAPCLIAIFASSPLYGGRPTGHQSVRALAWRRLDPGRTGLPYAAAAPVAAYLDFALEAPAMLLPSLADECRAFGEWVTGGGVTFDDWRAHLTTLFPEVRPRGYLELRSADTVAPEWLAAPLVLAAGLAYHAPTLRAAADLLGEPDPELLAVAGRCGLHEQRLARLSSDLFELALHGAAALGPDVVGPAELEEARAYFDRYTRRGLAPADELVRAAGVVPQP